MTASEPLHHFVDDYLSSLRESNPTAATFDGVHQFDDLLDDFGRPAIDAQIQALGGFARRLAAITNDSLTAVERIERPMVAAHIQAKLHDLEHVRGWERNPLVYGEMLGASLAGQALFAYAPVEQRARRVLSKLRQTPKLIQAARDNIKEPPGIFVKKGLQTLRGAQRFIDVDLPKAFSEVDDLGLLGDLADAQTEASDALKSYLGYLENDLGPKSRASFRLGADTFAQKLRLEEGIDLPLSRLLDIGLRELGVVQEEFKRAASKIERGDPMDIWRRVKETRLVSDGIVNEAQRQVSALATFIERKDLVSMPAGEPVVTAPTPEFFRWTGASMWTPGPFEARPTRAYYYLTEAESSWSDEQKSEHYKDLNIPTLWSISIHEAYPGHFLHFQHLRHVESHARKSLLMASSSMVEGWAHYCEHMVIEAGFEKHDPAVRLGQLAESLVRIARMIVAIRLHAEDLSVEQAVRFFREEAFVEESTARREAERGTFDPGYAVYTLGKLMLLKLREDYKTQVGDKFSLRSFHDALLRNGVAPIPVHRQLLLGPHAGAAIE
ncbi:MAG: DUF885 domain-containing protein [Acidobacteriota bacterium]